MTPVPHKVIATVWSNDGAEWTQSEPANAPIRVDKVLRFNGTRYFSATSEGVLTSRDAGKSRTSSNRAASRFKTSGSTSCGSDRRA